MVGVMTKRQKITLTARELFQSQTYEKTTMEEIARAVPMSKATLYTEFSNKEDVLLEICRNHIDDMNARLKALVDATDEDCLNTLKTMMLTLVEGAYGVTSGLRSPEALIFESTRLQALLGDRTERMPDIVSALLEKAKANGEIHRQADCDLLSKVVLSALTSFLPPYLCHFSKPSRPTLQSVKGELFQLLDLLCDGLRHQGTCDRRSI